MPDYRTMGYYESPIGYVLIEETDNAISSIMIQDDLPQGMQLGNESETLRSCMAQLNEYFTGIRKEFDMPLRLTGKGFRHTVWDALRHIPYGQTVSYKDIAVQIGSPRAVRAVGGANHHNPIWLVIPCHRVIGTSGKLVGYGGGLWRKEWLLAHEKKFAANEPS